MGNGSSTSARVEGNTTPGMNMRSNYNRSRSRNRNGETAPLSTYMGGGRRRRSAKQSKARKTRRSKTRRSRR